MCYIIESTEPKPHYGVTDSPSTKRRHPEVRSFQGSGALKNNQTSKLCIKILVYDELATK